ncbi:MAG TPA: hypothetical protein VNM39_15915 [Verrucomicrobiae bacterium]|nr:hypothetical protein [Verrucomicrobiae bacterium]
MPTITKRISLAAAATVDNALANSQYEFAPFDGTIEIGMLTQRDLITAAIFSGPDVLAEPGTPVPFTTAGGVAMPVYPDNYHWEDEVAHGDRLKITLSNGNAAGGPDIVMVVLRLTPA